MKAKGNQVVASLASRSPQREMTSNPMFLMNQQYCVGVCPVGLGKKSTSTCLPAFLICLKKIMMFLPNYHAISRPKSACHTSTSLLKNNQGKIPLFSGKKKTWRDQNCPYHSRFQVRYTTNAYISCAETTLPSVGEQDVP